MKSCSWKLYRIRDCIHLLQRAKFFRQVDFPPGLPLLNNCKQGGKNMIRSQ